MNTIVKDNLDENKVINSCIEDTLDIDPDASHAEIPAKYTKSGNPELVAI